MKPFILRAISGFFDIYDNGQIIRVKSAGILRKNNVKPTVGDYVKYHNKGVIEEVFERKNILQRPPIANIDQALLIVSVKEPEISLATINRYIFAIESRGIKPIIILSKADLDNGRLSCQRLKEFYKQLGYDSVIFSTKSLENLDTILAFLADKKTVLVGQSGVGKSSLINALCPQARQMTNEISASLGRGKHTTRVVEFLEVGKGFLADTPGFSLFDFSLIPTGELAQHYPGFLKHLGECKYRQCLHKDEPGCKIKEIVSKSELFAEIYQDYLKLLNESLERRKYD